MRLPPLNAVRAFEAAARCGGFAAAAADLGVTAGAVSRQVQLLERALGVRRLVAWAQSIAAAGPVPAAADLSSAVVAAAPAPGPGPGPEAVRPTGAAS